MPRLHNLLRVLVLLLLVLPATALGQSTTKGAIKGQTIDEGGLAIPGVVVTISSEAMMGQRQAESDADGRFLFNELAPGQYSLSAEKAAFAKVNKTGVVVNVGRTTNIVVEMPLATAMEEITVEEKGPAVDTESAQRGTVLTKDFLERIPAGRSYQSAVQMAAGVTGGANPNVAGAAYNENTYLLDGVNITDPVTGTFSLNFNFDAIEQIQVLTSAFDPEYGYNLGGVINVVTSTGSNTLEFRTGIYVTNGTWSPRLDARLAADGYELAPTDFDSKREYYQLGILVSGPVIRDKAWFLASYQMSRTLIANVGIDLPRDFDGHYVLGKLTAQPSAAHRFTVLFQTDPSTIDNLDQGDRYVEPEAQYRQAQGGYVGSLQWDWYISPEMFLETKATVQKSFIEVYGVPCTHNQDLRYHPCKADELENSLDFVTPGRYGSNRAFDSDNYPYFNFDDRFRFNFTSKFSLLQVQLLGTHDFKVGFEGDRTSWDYLFGYNGNTLFYDVNNLAYNPDTLHNYYLIELTAPYNFVATADHYGLFAQDVYKPIENLTFRYGLRWDRQITRNDQGENIVDVNLWGPRFSVIWDPWSDNKTALKASFGRFNDGGRLAVASYLSQSGLGQKLTMGELFDTFTSTAADNYFYVPNENTNTILDNTIAPRSDDFVVGAEREVVQDLVVSAYFESKFTRYIYAFDELNLLWDEDGYNVLGFSDGTTNSLFRMRTPSIARRDYYRMDLGFNKRNADRWETFGTYSYTVSRGSVQTGPSGFLQVPATVQYYENGLLGTDIRHDASIGGWWDIPNDPWTTSIGFTVMAESGYPVSRVYPSGFGGSSILEDTVGTYTRAEGWWDLNFLVRQDIPVRKGALRATGQVTNILNNRQGLSAGISQDNRWIIVGRNNPIQFQLGAEYQF